MSVAARGVLHFAKEQGPWLSQTRLMKACDNRASHGGPYGPMKTFISLVGVGYLSLHLEAGEPRL